MLLSVYTRLDINKPYFVSTENVHTGVKDFNTTSDLDQSKKPIITATTTENLVLPAIVAEEKTNDSDTLPGIKIKEITKAEEIRVTDDKSKATINNIRATSTTDNYEDSRDEIISEVDVESAEPVVTDESAELTPDSDYGGVSLAGTKNTRQTEIISNTTESVIDEMETKSNDSLKSNQEQKEDFVIIDGQKYPLKEAVGLQRGEDEEDDRKAGRKGGNEDGYSSSTDSSDTSIVNEFSTSFTEVSTELTTPLDCSMYYNKNRTDVSTTESVFDLDSSTLGLTDSLEAEIIREYECQYLLEGGSTESGFNENMLTENNSNENISTETNETLSYTTYNDTTESSSTMGSVMAKLKYSSSTPSDSDDIEKTSNPVKELSAPSMSLPSTLKPTEDDEGIENGMHIEFPKQPDDLSTHGGQMQHESDVGGTQIPEKIEGRSPGEPHLVPEFERNVSVHSTVLRPVYASSSTESRQTILDVTAGPGIDAEEFDGPNKSSTEEYDGNNILSSETVDPLGESYQKKSAGFMDFFDKLNFKIGV